MDIEELRKKPHLSASGINDYLECGLSYRLARIEKVAPDHKSDVMEFGKAIHMALADYQFNRKKEIILSSEDLQDLFDYYWRQRADERILYKEGKDFNILLSEGKNLLKRCYPCLENGYTVLAAEEPFEFAIEGIDIPIIGVIDLIEEDESGSLIITDYKTSQRAYSNDEVDKNFQLTLYHMAARHNGHENDIILKLDCLIKTKTPRFEPYYTTRSDSDLQRAVKKTQAVWDGISKGVFIPRDTSWKCKDCLYKSHCNKWFGGTP